MSYYRYYPEPDEIDHKPGCASLDEPCTHVDPTGADRYCGCTDGYCTCDTLPNTDEEDDS